MTGPSFRFRASHTPDFQTKNWSAHQPGVFHKCECGHWATTWNGLINHCLVAAGERREAA